jgi:hypothetical protein
MKLLDIFHLNEAPIEDMSFVGNWDKNSAFRTQDRKLLNNPKAQAKIIQKWEKVIVPFNIIFVNNAEANRLNGIGHVSTSWLEKNMPKTYPELKLNDEAVNVLYHGNKGSPRAPMTAWVIAHRFGHTLFPPWNRQQLWT